MNKRQKEVFQHQLDAEEAILKELEKQYRAALKDIREKIQLFESDIYLIEAAIRQTDMDDAARAAALSNRQSKIYQKQYQEALEKQLESILDKLHSDEYGTLQKYLQDSYEDGFLGTMYDLHGQGIPMIMPIDQAAAVKAIMIDSKISGGLYESLGVDVSGLKKAIRQEITRGIASGMGIHDIARNISNVSKAPMSRAKNIARTECHRIQQASTFDAQEKAKGRGADVVKQWDSTLDGSTRPVHMRLDGQIREVDKPFEAGGRKAMYPGDFGDPAEDCNCRCVSLTRARWALDDDELQALKDRAEFFGLDKTKDFDDFKKKYLKADDEMKAAQDRQAEIRARRQAYKEREAARKTEQAVQVPDFASMRMPEVKQWLDNNLKTPFGDIKGVNKDFLSEAAKVIARFENKLGGKTIPGLSIKFGGLGGSVAALYDNKNNVLWLKKTGSLKAFEAAQKKENERSLQKLKKRYNATTTYSGTIFHELGHAVDYDVNQQLSRMLSIDPDLYTSSVRVSVYAGSRPSIGATPRSEAWAENFAAYMEGGESAKDVLEEIRALIEDYFSKKKG